MKAEELLLDQCRVTLLKNSIGQNLSYIQTDSRKIEEGDIFCVNDSFGMKTSEFIEDAHSRKAKAVLIRKGSKFSGLVSKFDIIFESENDPESIVGYFASALKNNPSRSLKIIAVTGTNGKTSVTHILFDLLTKENKKCGLIGTIRTKFADITLETGYTTPDASFLHSIFAEMKKRGIEYVLMEASSHGLKLGRLNGTEISSAIFTNLTVDHMDFHVSMEDYRQSKQKLFDLLEQSRQKNRFGIVFRDFPGGEEFLSGIKNRNYSYPIFSLGNGGDYSINDIYINPHRTEYSISNSKNGSIKKISTNLLGNFNAINSAMSFIACEKLGLNPDRIVDNLAFLNPVSGRFQKIYDRTGEKLAIVDYAHTPDALENVIKSARELAIGRLVTLFGCGGDRDKTKRPIMAQVAEKYSDFIVVTSDNPRTENPEMIMDDIVSGFSSGFSKFVRITDRKQAIQKGVEILEPGGIFLVCGKGHENYQLIGKEKFHFSDSEEIEKAFRDF